MVNNDNGVQESRAKVALWEQRLTELSKMYAQGVESPLIKDAKGERQVPKRGAYTVRGIYSDFKYHDVGEDFYQVQYDGSIVRHWRTTPSLSATM